MSMIDFKLGDIGSLFTSIREAITGDKIQDPQALLEQVNKLETTMIKAKSDIIIAEAKSEHKLTSQWRPITMLVFVFIIANNYVIVPYAQALFSFKIPVLELTPQIWELVKLGLGGYVIGRSAEKIAKNLKDK